MKTAIIIQAPPAARSPRVRIATVFLLIVVSIALRSYLSLKAPFWRDEAITIFIARLPNSADVIQALSHDGVAPLFYFLLRIWMSLVGTSDVAIRVLPILLS